MRIAYLILTHVDPEFTRRLALKLTTRTLNHVFVHVDAKVSTGTFEALLEGLPSVHLLAERVPVYWGGFGSIEATICLMRTAMACAEFDRFVILQGVDYPIQSNTEIAEFFERHSGVEFIRAVSETKSTRNRDRHKYVLRHDMDRRLPFPMVRRKANAALLRWWPCTFASPSVLVEGQRCEVFRGWAQFAVTRDLARYFLEFHDGHAEFNEFFRGVYCSDESYFHTIVYNSNFASRTVGGGPLPQEARSVPALLNLTYFEYPDAVRVFSDAKDLDYLMSTGCLYFRKASLRGNLLDRIDEVHGR